MIFTHHFLIVLQSAGDLLEGDRFRNNTFPFWVGGGEGRKEGSRWGRGEKEMRTQSEERREMKRGVELGGLSPYFVFDVSLSFSFLWSIFLYFFFALT